MQLLLTLLLLVAPSLQHQNKGQSDVRMMEKYFDGSDFDLNDHLFGFEPIMKFKNTKHLQTDPETTSTDDSSPEPAAPTPETPAEVPVETAPVVTLPQSEPLTTEVKNDEVLPENLFETPTLVLNEPHDNTESAGYLQILQAMKSHPVVEAPPQQVTPVEVTSLTKVIDAKPGLNSALTKILTITNQFVSSTSPAIISNSITVNQLLEQYASQVFGGRFSDSNENAVAPPQQYVVESVPVENAEPAQVITDEGVEEKPALVEQSIDSNEPVTQRLLTLMRMHAEHVENKDKEIIADDDHYGYLKHFSNHLNCLTEVKCDFSNHLSHLSDSIDTHSKHFLEKHLANNLHFQADPNSTYQTSLADLIQSIPSLNSNEDIKKSTSEWLAKNQNKLSDFQTNWPSYNDKFQQGLSDFKANLSLYQNLTPDQYLTVLDGLSQQYKAKIDEEFTANGLTQKVDDLTNERNGIIALHKSLKSVIPINGVLDQDFNRLEANLDNHIAIFTKAKNATPEQFQNARIKLKNNLQLNINGVDADQNSQLIQTLANNTDALLKSDFGKSLNKENLDFIVQKSINALREDFDQMKDNNKASGFFLDQSDLQQLANDVVDSLKQSREQNQKVVLDLVDFNKQIQFQNKLFNAAPNSSDDAQNAADLLISYENAYYQALSSDEFYDDLKNYISKFSDIYSAHVKPLQPFFAYSKAFKTLTAGLDNPKALGTANPNAVRLLLKSTENQMAHLNDLSSDDRVFYKMINHLTAEWAITKDQTGFIRKLDSIILALQGKKPLTNSIRILEVPEAHRAFALWDQLTNAITGVINNLGTSAKAASGLSDTIAHGQELVKNAADTYKVGDLLTSNSTQTSPGFFGSVKNKVKSWFGWRNLEVHYGLFDAIDSVKNLYKSVTEAKQNADKLKKTIDTAQGYANDVQKAAATLNSIVGNGL